jgi:hypothetical protein
MHVNDNASLCHVDSKYIHSDMVVNEEVNKSLESPLLNLESNLVKWGKEASFYLQQYQQLNEDINIVSNNNEVENVNTSAILRSGKETRNENIKQQHEDKEEEENMDLEDKGIVQESNKELKKESTYQNKIREGQESSIPTPSLENNLEEDIVEDETHLYDQFGRLIENSLKEDENENREVEEHPNQEVTPTPTLPFPNRLKVNNQEKEEIKDIKKIFEQVSVNMPLLELIKKIPLYAKVLKECCTKRRKKKIPPKHVYLAELSSTCFSSTLPKKLKDPGTPIISCRIGNHTFNRALLDLGAGVNVMPKSVYDELGITGVQPTKIIIKLADRSTKIPLGLLENVLVQVEDFIYPADFLVIETQPSQDITMDVSLILGRPFLATLNAEINCRSGQMTIACQGSNITLNVFGLENEIQDGIINDNAYSVEQMLIENEIENENMSAKNEHIDTLDLGEEDIEPNKESIIEDTHLNNIHVEKAGELELKPLPHNLKYVFLDKEKSHPVIIGVHLKEEEEAKLIQVIKDNKEALGWKISDIKGISPQIVQHRINLEDELHVVREVQRRLNPKMMEVVKKEIIKWLDNDIIYPISDSRWVSPVHVVPKKSGITVVANQDNELVPTRIQTGWRVCIDYQKLNQATRKDHFPLPFIDQVLERLAEHDFYCFLDGYSGYNQISITPEDQEKTTFTCPFGTFAFRRMPYGLCNAPGTFQRCMYGIFSNMIENYLEIFMDDFSVYGKTFDHCLEHLRLVLERCKEKNLILN